ncbi:MAG: hypothetical protein QF384_13225, partial [Alphaproteobacteria bacterium]|nr:hypothetical protein [Alphaproteobacteria bacterium]
MAFMPAIGTGKILETGIWVFLTLITLGLPRSTRLRLRVQQYVMSMGNLLPNQPSDTLPSWDNDHLARSVDAPGGVVYC